MINLPEVIQEMLSYKESLGFSRKTYENYLSDFNKYFSHSGYNKFTAETVLPWCERRDTETPEGFRRRVTPLRELSKYMYAMGYTDYIVPTSIFPITRRTMPYIFTDNILLVFIPVGSIYIMNAVFTLAYSTSWEYAEVYSLMSVVILLVINVLVFYVYIKLADDLQVKRMNVVYEQQLELCERHQEETEISMLQIRDVRHSMRNHFISILAYAERGECDEIIQFVDDVIEDGKLELSGTVNTGNIVTDSLVGYWERIAEQKGIEFRSELSIPMEMPFKGADISLILGNLLENAVEGAGKAEKRKYIRLKIKYDKKNLLIMVENSYKGKLVKGRGEELRTTKTDKDNHGIGLSSVRRVVGKYHGTVSIDDSIPECFVIRMVLYGE